jgi:hypothetical protein
LKIYRLKRLIKSLSIAIFLILLDKFMSKRLTSRIFSLLVACTLGLLVTGCGSAEAKQARVIKKNALPAAHILYHLDVDGNGLYDDVERKAMLTELQKISPEINAIFDINGDSKVTVLEQTTGRHPLSLLTNNNKVVASKIKIPWSPNIYSEWISTSALQEDAAQGKVTKLANRGTVNKQGLSQGIKDKHPLRALGRGGIEFAKNAGQHLTMGVQPDARWNYRWALFTFRIDGMSGTGDTTLLVDINRGKGAGRSSPKIWYNKRTGLNLEYVGQGRNGLDRRLMSTKDIHTDGKTWNVVVMGTRYGRMYGAVNGRDITIEQPDHFAGPRLYKGKTFIGDSKTDNSAWALDALLLGTTEPSEAMVRKLTGWAAHRLGFQSTLPQDHPYAAQRPVLDEEDYPYRYVHDNAAWTAWGESLKDKNFKKSNAGGKPVISENFERVFYDDFRRKRIGRSDASEGELWQAPGFNTAVGASAQLAVPGSKPEVYAHDANAKKQTLSLAPKGNRWVASAFYSVNDMGHGYTWDGPKIFRIRSMFPKVPQNALAPGLWPAFWSYGTEWLFWRTSNRIETDWFEFHGKNGQWLNGLASHFHYSNLNKNIYAKNNQSHQSYKVYGGELTEAKSNIPGGLYFWDGQYHTWEFIIDTDMTYINVTVPDKAGKDRWVEVARSKTAATYLERLDIQLDYALKKDKPQPVGEQKFVIDFIEVLQKTAKIEAYDKPFSAAPVINGEAAIGSTLTCKANLQGVNDIRYYWFASGYPLTYSSKPSYTLTLKEKGSKIRCMVKAVGARNMPEAWSSAVSLD